MTFREEAAIRIFSSVAEACSNTDVSQAAMAKAAILLADELAMAACAEWGHDAWAEDGPGVVPFCRRCDADMREVPK